MTARIHPVLKREWVPPGLSGQAPPPASEPRRQIIDRVANAIAEAANRDDGVFLVGIDGVDGAGKSTFGDELELALAQRGRLVVRATVDSFHRPRVDRYRLGKHSPEGFYRDSYDYALLRGLLLDPLRSGKGGIVRRAAFDQRADSAVNAPEEQVDLGSLLVIDGLFMHRPELRDYWNLSLLLHVPWERNHHLGSGPALWNVNQPEPSSPLHRYAEGNRIYFRECDPAARATIVLDNTDLDAPQVLAWRIEERRASRS